jgi:tripartite-type tricarboxylate transporter receptor subunit TctC
MNQLNTRHPGAPTRRSLLAAGLAGWSGWAAAQPSSAPSPEATNAGDFPRRAVTFVLPGPAGGGPDLVARVLGDLLAARWGVPVVVDNRPGATGMIGAESVAHGDPSGHRLLFTFTALVQAPAVFARVPYDLERDFAPVMQVANAPVVLAVRADSPIRSVADLVARGRQSTPLSYGSFGLGSSYHIYGEALKRSQGLNLLHVPYKGEALALQDLLGGQIDASFVSVGTGMAHIKAGKIRALAVVARARSSVLPQVPTFLEAGVEGVDAVGWFGVLAPSATPPAVVRKIAADLRTAVLDKAASARLRELGFEPVADSGPAQFHAFLRAEVPRWQKLISEAGIKPE